MLGLEHTVPQVQPCLLECWCWLSSIHRRLAEAVLELHISILDGFKSGRYALLSDFIFRILCGHPGRATRVLNTNDLHQMESLSVHSASVGRRVTAAASRMHTAASSDVVIIQANGPSTLQYRP
jgi:hypothetical protein